MSNYAVIDCGTNTFHLLIATPNVDGSFDEVYRERRFVKLAEEGIQRIGDAPYGRALDALIAYSIKIKEHNVKTTRVSGTAALRTAENGSAFVVEVKEKTGLDIMVIPGREEAQLIYHGVARAIGPQSEPWMVMDIGGGSVEFIIIDKEGVRWFESFPIGVAVLYKQLHRSEPISSQEIAETFTFLNEQLEDLYKALDKYPVSHLVGAAGTFDVLADLLGKEQLTPYATAITLGGFHELYQRILKANREERHQMQGVPDDRADMIVVALILVRLILDQAGINQMTVSFFSMKEGMLAQLQAEE